MPDPVVLELGAMVAPGPSRPQAGVGGEAVTAGRSLGLVQSSCVAWAVVKARMRDVLLRTDLWSDQILVLRAVQTLTMLDLQHNYELVWNLGGYTRTEQAGFEPSPGPPRSGTSTHNADPVGSP